MKIATWNVNSLNVRLPHLQRWLADANPDIVALQETKLSDERFPREALEAAGYHVACNGQKTYNGVAIVAREPLTDVVTDPPSLTDPQRRILAATIGEAGSNPGQVLRVGGWIVFAAAFDIAGLALWPEYVAEYVLALTLGIAFQYFSIASMRNLGMRDGVIAALKADTLSLTAIEVGMFGWMALAASCSSCASTASRQCGVLVHDADRDSVRILHRLSSERLAAKLRYQGTDGGQPARNGARCCQKKPFHRPSIALS